MKKLLMSAASVAVLATGVAAADEPWTISGTVGITSNYMFRGYTQTDGNAALQAGVTAAHESGLYAGFWGSNVDLGIGANLETDFFVGYGGSLDDSTTFDLNVTYYFYPGADDDFEVNYTEIIGGLTHDFGFASAGIKAAYSPEFYGTDEDAFWLAGNVTVPLGDWLSVSGNVGYQWVSADNDFDDDINDYLHYDIGVTAKFDMFALDLRYIGTDVDDVVDDAGLKPDEEFVATATFSF